MKKYQWNSAILQKKSQRYDRLMFGFAIVALAVRLLWANMPSWLLLIFLAGVVGCSLVSWRIRREDSN